MNQKMKGSLLIFAAIAVMLSGCSKGAETNTNPSPADSKKENALSTADKSGIVHPKEPVELYFYSNTSSFAEKDVRDRWWNYMNSKYPNFVLKFVPKVPGGLPELLAAGQPIDIMFTSIGGVNSNLIQNGLQYDLTELAKKHGVDLNRFEPETLDMIKNVGGLYGLPVSNARLILFYNKDIFDKFGAPYPKDDMTWDDMLALSKRVTRLENGVQYFGFTAYIQHQMKMNPLSLNIVDSKTGRAAINTDKWKMIIQKVLLDPIMQNEVYKQAVISANDVFSHNDNFGVKRNVAMYAMDSNAPIGWDTNPATSNFNWDIVKMPTFKENPDAGPQPYPNYLYITNISKKKDEAMQVLKFIASDEMQTLESKKGYFSAIKSPEVQKVFASEATSFKGKNLNAVINTKPSKPMTITPSDDLVIKAIENRLFDYVKGQLDLNSLLRIAEEEANKEIEKASKK
ncbi:MAG: extracellular solute-binding protein family 1 [Paenibacillus sp.]|nr:extracellular solute-binding protein family 1 [Paenibacillus sp.]